MDPGFFSILLDNKFVSLALSRRRVDHAGRIAVPVLHDACNGTRQAVQIRANSLPPPLWAARQTRDHA